MIPDLLDTKHVRLDPCILILYYVILWRGCFILNTRSYASSDGCYAGQLYLCCLRIIPIVGVVVTVYVKKGAARLRRHFRQTSVTVWRGYKLTANREESLSYRDT